MIYSGTLYLYWNKTYSWNKVHVKAWKLFEEFGSIVKEDLLPGVSIVYLFDEEDIKLLNKSEVSNE